MAVVLEGIDVRGFSRRLHKLSRALDPKERSLFVAVLRFAAEASPDDNILFLELIRSMDGSAPQPRIKPARVSKPDLNSVSVDELQEVASIPLSLAQTIVANRPFFSLMQLKSIAGVDAQIFDKISQTFEAASVEYENKVTGAKVNLTPNWNKVLVRAADDQTEAASDLSRSLGLKTVAGRRADKYKVFSAPQTETGLSPFNELAAHSHVALATPSFKDGNNNEVFIDTEFAVVQFVGGTTDQQQAVLLANAGLIIAERHRTPGLVTITIPGAKTNPNKLTRALAYLNGLHEVAFAEPGFVAVNDLEGLPQFAERDSASANNAESGAQGSEGVPWNFLLIDAPLAWTATRGSERVVICVIDTGVDIQHPAIQSSLLSRPIGTSWNFDDDEFDDPIDEQGHGTFIAGLLVGNGTAGVVGLCPGCRLLPLRVPLSGATLSYAKRRDAILYALDSISENERLILNLSWKTSGDIPSVRDAISEAVRRNALVVCSAGNWPDAPDEEHYPSDYVSALSVGSIGSDGLRAIYSFYGSAVDLAAPGGNGENAQNLLSAGIGGTTAVDFGTSFSAPQVAGAAALLWSLSPALAAPEVRSLLEASAQPVPDGGLGHGLIRVGAAVHALDPATNQNPNGGSAGADGLSVVNTGSVDLLISTFSLLPLTARLLVAHRPFARIEELQNTLGLSSAQYEQIREFRA